MPSVSTHQRIVQALILAYRGQYTPQVCNHPLPQGWVPLFEFQGPTMGGSAANTRLSEVKRPAGDNNGKGIPIEKDIITVAADQAAIPATWCYKLGVDPIYIDLSEGKVRLDRDKLHRDGLDVEEYTDVARGNPSRSVRIVKRSKPERAGQANLFAPAHIVP